MPILQLHKKFGILLPACAVIMIIMTISPCLGFRSDDLRNRIQKESSEVIMDRGRDYFRQNRMDSALMIFNYLADGYTDALPVSEKRIAILAKNNVGIIYAFEYMDYKRGYEVLTDAFELAEKSGMGSAQAVISINLVELLRLYGICLQSENVNDRIERYLNLGVQKAMTSKEYRGLASLVINTIENDLEYPLDKLMVIENPSIPASIEGVAYARECIKAAKTVQKGLYAEGRRILENAYRELPEFSRSAIDDMGHRMVIARIFSKEGNNTEAERIAFEVITRADSLGTIQNKLIAAAFLASLPGINKDKYARLFMNVKDEALSKGQLQMVSEIDFRRSLNREREENRRLSLQYTRLFWGLGIGCVLLIIFSILIGLLIFNRRKLKERNAFLYSKIQQSITEELRSVTQSRINEKKEDDKETSKYAGSSLTDEKMDEIQQHLVELMYDQSVICDSEMSLTNLSSRLNVNTTYLSRVINERFGKTFSALLNESRIKIATRRMSKNSPYANQTIEAIARSVGYSSRSTFISYFKKFNGMTPSEYLKITLSRETTDDDVEDIIDNQ